MIPRNGDDPRHIAPIPRAEETTPSSDVGQPSDVGSSDQVLRALAREHGQTAARVDVLISENRHFHGEQRTQAKQHEAVEAAILRHAAEVADIRGAIGVAPNLDKLEPGSGLRLSVADLDAKVDVLATIIGKPPNPHALLRASSVDLSPESIASLELGTGLCRSVAEMRVMDMQIALKAGASAGKAAGARGAVIGGSASAVIVAMITHADKIAELARVVFGG